MAEFEETIKLFWTGGWDSTFRLLQIVLIEKRKVQPYYLLDYGRGSWKTEKSTMDSLRKEIFKRYPYTKELVLPTLFFDIKDIKLNDVITESYNRLKAKQHLGIQYDWLARFCEQHNLRRLELSIEKGAGSQIDRVLIGYLKSKQLELDEKFKQTDEYVVFSYFRFPVIYLTKQDMKKNAKENGFLDVMNLTWFCHTPINGLPCGACNPCRSVICDGLGYRIPISGHMRKIFWNFIFCLKSALRRFPMFYQFLKAVKGNFRCH